MDTGIRSKKLLLSCEILSGVGHVAIDLMAALLYPGYSLRDQAVSELIAIGAPAGHWVVPQLSL